MEKLLRWAVFAGLFFIPLCSPEWFPYLNLIYPVLVLFVFAIFVIDRLFIFEEGKYSSKMILPVVLLFFSFVISAVFSKVVSFNLMNLRIIYPLGLFLVSLTVFSAPRERKNAASFLLAGAVLTAVFAFYQKFTGLADMAAYLDKHKEIASNSIIYGEFLKNIGSGRVFSTFLNANIFAGFLVMVLPVAAGCYLVFQKNIRGKIITGIILVILLIALALTGSAGGLAALLFALIIFLLTLTKEKKKILLGSAVLVVACLGTALVLRPDITDFSKADNSILNRLGYFKEAVKIFMNNPLTGSGVNTYGLLSSDGVKFPHNWYLQVLAETGLAGFTALLFFVYVLVKESVKTLKKLEGNEKFIFAGFFAGFCGFLVHNLFDVDSNFWQNSLIAFTLAGILASGFKSTLKVEKNPVFFQKTAGFLKQNYFFILSMVLMAGAIVFSSSRFQNEARVFFICLSIFLFLPVVTGGNTFVRTKLDLFIPVLLVTFFSSLFVSVNRFASFQAVYLLLGGVMLFYTAVNKIKKHEDVKVFSFLTGLCCLLLSLAGIIQHFWLKTERVDAFFPNANLLGGFLAAGTGLLLYALIGEKGKVRLFQIVSAMLSISCIYLTKSRGAFLALGIILLTFVLFLNLLKKKKIVEEPVRFWSTVIILLFIGLSLTTINPIINRAARVSVEDDAAYSRAKMSGSALKLFKDRPILGYGLDTFKDAAVKYRFPEGGTIGNYTRVAHHAHNEYLQAMAELGFAGLILVLVFIFILIVRFIFIINNTGDKEKIFTAYAVFTALIGLMVHALVDFNFHCLPTLVFFVFLCGVLFSGYLSTGKSFEFEKPVYLKLKVYTAVFTVLLLFSAGMSYLSVYHNKIEAASAGDFEKNMKLSIFLNPMFADSYAGLGKLYAGSYLNSKEKKLFFEAEKNFKMAVKNSPANPESNRELGLFYFYAGYPALALQEYAAAIKKGPSDVFFKTEAARICFIEGGYELAEKYAREAVTLEPNYAGGHWALYEIYTKQNKIKAAGFEKERALEINKKYRDSAVITYEKNLVFLGGGR
ncbi:MAG: hypothetical protein A2231_03835 [Candidatus Firestonebacteria bacterium RIFOXYA2_FULL_40_8]|nr:MAG: hypothetical protein A2231_03835 [Candidatus Firestonebacteria bacterium RIFOXYA2_FULL_40_8]